jgi:serine/threonine protein kinase
MSISQTTPEETSAGHLSCPKCKAALPLRATFCSSCGERLTAKKQASSIDEQDPKNRYRITTLLRRRPYVNLYFALDNQQPLTTSQPRMVAIREIDVSHLQKEARVDAIAQIQQEYDQLRRWPVPHMLNSVDLRLFQGRISLISGLPVLTQDPATTTRSAQRLYTLQDFLQSGQGLPKESRALEWVRNLCLAVERLHRRHIVLGDLDPYTVVLNKNSVEAELNLMVFWLRPTLQPLLPQFLHTSRPELSYFSAPEALDGKAEVRSDVYSLGALLYLLLTGTPPNESTLRHRRRLRTPREINSRLSQHVDECVMQALAIEPEERFATVTSLLGALQDTHFRITPRKAAQAAAAQPEAPVGEAETVRIIPLSQRDVVRWRAARDEQHHKNDVAAQQTRRMPLVDVASLAPPASDPPANSEPEEISPLLSTPPPEQKPARRTRSNGKKSDPALPAEPEARGTWKKRITGLLPTTRPEEQPPIEIIKESTKRAPKEQQQTAIVKESPAQEKTEEQASKPKGSKKAARTKPKMPATLPVQSSDDVSLLKQFRRLILGQQLHKIEAAAIIETPVRVRPEQPYNVRLHIMGRDEPTPHPDAYKGAEPAGLSALCHGEEIQVEVRSVLQQGYTYVLQKAPVTIPANGYAAEVTIPMQPQGGTSTSMRNRLHVFFLDDQHQPIYEKPFIVEVYVSPLVQFGREGHQVLTIPL